MELWHKTPKAAKSFMNYKYYFLIKKTTKVDEDELSAKIW